MRFHFCCVVLALTISSSTAMPDQCTIPAVNHGKVGHYSTKMFENNRFRECFYQLPSGHKIDDSDSVILRCEKGYLPAGSTQISKVHRSKEDVVICEDGTWSKPLRCEAEITCGEPPPVEFATVTSLFTEDYPLGAIVAYECQSGYAVQGRSTTTQCVMSDDGSQAIWRKAPMSCVAQPCGDPGSVINARRIGSDFTFSHTVQFECEEGYKLNGTDVRHCEASGLWSGKLPTCERIYCDHPRNPENGSVRYLSLEYGTELRYECNKGFNLSNHQQRFCTGNGTWSKKEPVCMEINCDEVEAPKHGIRRLTDGLKVDSLVIYSCEENKILVGASTSKCLSDGQWTFPPPKCVEANCDEPRTPKHGFRQLTGDLKVDSLVIYSCEEGKILLGASTSKCLSDGQWTFPPPQCVDHCEVPPYVQHGKIGQYETRIKYYGEQKVFVPFEEGEKVKPNEVIYLRCNKDFVLEKGSNKSEKQITCEDGTWSVPLQCKSVSCDGEALPIENGYPVVNIRTHGHTIYYRCNEFYVITAKGHVECVYGKWEGYTPVCTDARCYTNQLNFPGLVKPKGEFIANKKDFSISCEEGYQVKGRKTKISCELGKWNINYNPCVEEIVVRCPEIDEKDIFNVRYNNSRKFNSAAHYYCKDPDQKILGFNFRICQEDGEWSGDDPECVEPEFSCPEIDDKGVFTIRYNNERKVNSGAYYSCKHQDQKIFGSDVRTCQEDGRWSGGDPECVEAPSGSSDAKISTTSSPPTSASREPLIGGSLDSQKQDDCCCTSNYLNTNVLASDGGEQTLLGTKVKKGDTVEIGCKDRTAILVWRNGLRVAGPVSLTCDTCQTWGVEDIPSCIPLSPGDTWIVLNRNMKLLPGGIVEIRQNDNVQIQCSVISLSNSMHYPEWRSSPPKTVAFSYNAAGSELRTLMLIDDFKAKFTGRYECFTTDTYGYQYGPTILNLKIATAEMRCPILDEKDDFIISYSNSRKVNSIAVYFCRKRTEDIRGKNVRTCLDNGEWTSEEEPSCVDIVCPKFTWNRYLDISYSKEQYVDSVATFHCRIPRIVTGSSTSTCLGNGTWSHSQPTCEVASSSHHRCPELDGKDTFIINYSNGGNVNSEAYYICKNVSKKIDGSSTRTCQQNGEWSDSEPVCVDITCRKFGVFGSLIVEYTKENKVGSIAEFHCTPPAALVGNFITMCRLNGTWSRPQPSCQEPEVRCPAIEEKGIFIVRYNNDRKIGSDADYSCRGPDQKMTGSNVRRCQANGEWSGVDPVCEGPGCEIDSLMASLKPHVVPDLRNVTGELLPSGFELTLFCDNNMVLEGNNKARCNQQGRWNVGSVQCILGCFVDSSNSPSTLIIEPKKDFYRFGEFAVLSCPEGFELTTEVERVMCMGSTGWSDPLPECKNMIYQED